MRFGFVGLGRAARLYHLPAVAALEVRSPWAASTRRSSSGVLVAGHRHPDVRQPGRAPGSGAPDVVVVATPPALHADVCIQALEAGAHVICEKPFVTSSAEGDRVLAAAAAAGRRIAVNHQFREKPIFPAVRDAIRPRAYGRLAFCQLWQLMNLAPWDEPTEWRAGMSDRTLLEGGVHLVDLMIVLFGEPPAGRLREPLRRLPRQPGRGRRPARHARVLGRTPRPDHDRSAVQGRHALLRGARRVRAGVAASVTGRARARPDRDQACRTARHPIRSRSRRACLGGAGNPPQGARSQPEGAGRLGDHGALPSDRGCVSRRRRAAVERTGGPRHDRCDRRRVRVGGGAPASSWGRG